MGAIFTVYAAYGEPNSPSENSGKNDQAVAESVTVTAVRVSDTTSESGSIELLPSTTNGKCLRSLRQITSRRLTLRCPAF